MNGDNWVTKTLQMRSIPKRDFEKYLITICESHQGNVYFGDGWECILSEERTESLGKFSIVAVDVTLKAKAEVYDALRRRLMLQFTRGGG